MSVYLSPGVYIEEIPSGSKPIEAVSTSMAAFVGAASRGPAGEAFLIHSLDEYKAEYGEITSESDAMGLAVQAFYMNGGKDAYICRLAGDSASAAEVSLTGQATSGPSTDTVTVKAKSVGAWGNDVYARIVKPDKNSLTFDLEVGHQTGGVFKVDETFSGLSMDVQDSNYALTQVNGNSLYVELALTEIADPDESAAQYQNAVLTSGLLADNFADALGTGSATMTLNINGMGAKQITIGPIAGIPGANAAADVAVIAPIVQTAVRNLGTEPAYQNFTCAASGTRFVLTSYKAHAKSVSSASVSVYDSSASNSLAKIMALDSNAKAKLIGTAITTVTANFKTWVTTNSTLQINVDGYGPATITLSADGLTGTDANADGPVVAKKIRDAVRALNSKIPSYAAFECAYSVDGPNGSFTLTSGSGSTRASSLSVTAGGLADDLELGGLSGNPGRMYDDSTAKVIPQQTLGTLDQGVQFAAGLDDDASSSDFNSFFQNTLRKVRDVSILVLPGQTWAADGSGNAYISETLAHCEALKNRMVIIDPPSGLELTQSALVDAMGLPTSTYSVLYYPWVKIANPLYDEDENPNADTTVTIAPSAFAAGMWAKIDGTRGVWKAPAGVETQLLGLAGLKYTVEEGEQDQLNPLGVNCIRKLPSFGSVIWGSRTLATKAKPEWRYVPVRRTAIFIERSIYEGIQWAVFEPNDHPLWSSLRANIESFMNGLFRASAFQGQKASDAYFVRCGLGDTMTQADIDRGQVIVVVGFAPLKPAEFVIVRIQQKVGQQ